MPMPEFCGDESPAALPGFMLEQAPPEQAIGEVRMASRFGAISTVVPLRPNFPATCGFERNVLLIISATRPKASMLIVPCGAVILIPPNAEYSRDFLFSPIVREVIACAIISLRTRASLSRAYWSI